MKTINNFQSEILNFCKILKSYLNINASVDEDTETTIFEISIERDTPEHRILFFVKNTCFEAGILELYYDMLNNNYWR